MTKRKKLPSAKDWQARHIDDWNTTTFHTYLSDKHKEIFGVDYVPFRGWRVEQGLIGNLIGTKTKARQASNEQVKRFIDECFATYKPSREYPGTSFGFSWSYRKNIWQRVQAESKQKAEAVRAEEEQKVGWEELAEWL